MPTAITGHKSRMTRGFTLIELMIVVAIVAILAAIAYPSYQEHVRKTRRAQARVDLTETVQLLERYYSARNSYAGFNSSNLRNSQANFYTISFAESPNAIKFEIEAEPIGAQSSDKCGTLTINSAGKKGQIDGMTTALCW